MKSSRLLHLNLLLCTILQKQFYSNSMKKQKFAVGYNTIVGQSHFVQHVVGRRLPSAYVIWLVGESSVTASPCSQSTTIDESSSSNEHVISTRTDVGKMVETAV